MARGKDRTGPLEKVDGDPVERLQRGLLSQETIVLCGMPLYECADLIELLARSIPEDRKVIVLEDQARFSGVRQTALPKNHEFLHYDTSSASGVSLTDIAETALNMAGDYLIVPDLLSSDFEVFRQIATKFDGIIVGADVMLPLIHKDVRSIADILIEMVHDRAAPLGINAMWARRTHPLEAIPAQGAGPHFVISAAGQISYTSASTLDRSGNDTRRIRQLLPLVRQSSEDLSARVNPNDNAFTELVRDLTRLPQRDFSTGIRD